MTSRTGRWGLAVALGLAAAAIAWWAWLSPGGPFADRVPAADGRSQAPARAGAPGAAPGAGLAAGGKARLAEIPGAAAAAAAAIPTTFRGLVVDERGQAIPAAAVRVSPGERLSEAGARGNPPPTASAADGRFACTVPGGGRYLEVRASAPGFVTKNAEVALDRDRETRVVLVPACALRVRVVEAASGKPVPGTAVRVVSGSMVNAVYWSALENTAADEQTTDARGIAVLTTEGGPALVYVMPKEFAPLALRGVDVLRTGTEVEARVVRGGSVEGLVQDDAGKPVAGARVVLDAQPCTRREVRSDAKGHYSVDAVPAVDPASHEEGNSDAVVTVTAEGFAEAQESLDLPALGATSHVEPLVLHRAWRVKGWVVAADGRVVPDVVVGVEASGLEWVRLGVHRVVTDAKGRFVLEGMGPGTWEFWIRDARDETLSSERISWPVGEPPEPFDLTLPDLSGRVTVEVVDAVTNPVRDALVRLAITRGFVSDRRTAGLTDAQGRLDVANVPREGVTLLVAGPAGAPLSRLLTRDELAGGTVRVTLGAGEISGRLVHLDGSPAQARLVVQCPIGACIEAGSGVDAAPDGSFRFRALLEGRYEIALEDRESGSLVGNDRYVEAGAKDLHIFLAIGEEVARLHPHFVLKDAATGDPVSVAAFQARVYLAPAGSPVAASLGNEGYVHGPETSADGHFLTMEPVAPGTYDATIKVPGWRPARRERMTFPWLGEPPVVRLERGTSLSGTVTDADGAPNPGVRVRVQTQTGTTDEHGVYRLSGLVEGHADVAFGGHLVRPRTFPIEVPATGALTLDAQVERSGALTLIFVDYGSFEQRGALRLRLTPLAGGPPLEQSVDRRTPLLADGFSETGTTWGGLVPGRYRADLERDGVALPSQEIDVRVGETSLVRFTPKDTAQTPPR